MKNKIWIYFLLVIGFGLILTNGCEEDSVNKPLPTGIDTVIDIDNNIYQTLTIGSQTWMIENLKVSRYRNGDIIPEVSDDSQWRNLNTGAFCYFNNNADNNNTYGKLYNWYALDDSRNIAPEGWHVATDAEWAELISYLGGESVAGGKLKALDNWNSPNTGATNESGFTAIPGGYRFPFGTYSKLGYYGNWWTITENNTFSSWYLFAVNNYESMFRNFADKASGFSVRCVKD